MQRTYYTYLDTPIGSLLLAGDGESLTELGFPAGKGARRHHNDWQRDATVFREASDQLLAYFAGERREFSLHLAPAGTPFQLQVWRALQDIPYGETRHYGELARAIKRPTASRAVGAANGRNPLPVIIPCHRVIGSTGKLVGFGGGLPTKVRLLELERRVTNPGLPF